MKSHGQQLADLNSSASTVLAYGATDAGRALIAWIDALTAMYVEDLLDVKPDQLLHLQGKLAQLKEMRAAASGSGKTNGRV